MEFEPLEPHEVGHNNPPSMIDMTGDTARDISDFMSENPVLTGDTARYAKEYLDRGKLCLKDLEDERDGKVRPFNEQVKEINETYRSPRDVVSGVLQELSRRLTFFVKEEERKRIEAADEAARIAEEAKQKALEAERLEQDAFRSSDTGELGVDVAAHVAAASSAFREFEKADRAAAIAEKETKVKIAGGFSRAVSLRKKETLSVIDPIAAINEIGLTADIAEALIKSARAFKKLRGRFPEGISVEITEEL